MSTALNQVNLPAELPGRGGTSVVAHWQPLLIPMGAAPRPAPRDVRFGSAAGATNLREEKLGNRFKPAGQFNPAVSVTEFGDMELHQELDRPWAYDELPAMAERAGDLLSRTGFVRGCGQHFIGRDADGLWFIFADEDHEVWPDRVSEETRVAFVLGYPPEFLDLPSDLRAEAGGPYGALAWAIEASRAASKARQMAAVSRKMTSAGGVLADAFKSGDLGAASRHLEWMVTAASAQAWEQGAFFRAVQVSDIVAEDRRANHRKGALASARSVGPSNLAEVLRRFIADLESELTEPLSNTDVARRAWQAKTARDPRFHGVSLPGEDALMRKVSKLRRAASRAAPAPTVDLGAAYIRLVSDNS